MQPKVEGNPTAEVAILSPRVDIPKRLRRYAQCFWQLLLLEKARSPGNVTTGFHPSISLSRTRNCFSIDTPEVMGVHVTILHLQAYVE